VPLASKTVQNFQGLFANYQILSQPKGTVSRDSNLWFATRGALRTIPGSKIICAPGVGAPSVFWRAIQVFFPSIAASYRLFALSVIASGSSTAVMYDVTGATWNTPAAMTIPSQGGSFAKRPAILGGTPQPTPVLLPYADKLIAAVSDSVPPFEYDGSTPAAAPTLSSTAGGALPPTTYYVRVVYNGYATPSAESVLAVAGGNVLVVHSPPAVVLPLVTTTYDVYVGTSSGTETKQNTAPINIGTNWTEPNTGLVAGGAHLSALTDSPGGKQLINDFNSNAKYAKWKPNHTYSQGKIITIIVDNISFEYSATQQGTTGDGSGTPGNPNGADNADQFPTQVNATIVDGDMGWECLGPLPGPPPGAAYVFNHLGFLWLWGTASDYLADGISGPDAIWQSGLNDPESFDPAYTGYVAKGNGETAQGGAVLTLEESGIAATQQLVLFKDASTYSVFGDFSTSIEILQAPGGVGCIAPGTIQFMADLGILRLSYKGVTLFDGQNDTTELYTDPIRSYIFGEIDPNSGAYVIQPLDFANIQLAKSTQVKNPSCYAFIAPVLGGTTTRLFIYDLEAQIWAIGDLPWNIGAASFQPTLSGMESVVGLANDGTIRRILNPSDLDWDGTPIVSSVRLPEFGRAAQPLYIRGFNIRARGSGRVTSVTATYKGVQGKEILRAPLLPPQMMTGPVDFKVKVLSVHIDLAFVGQVLIEGIEYQIKEKQTTRVGA